MPVGRFDDDGEPIGVGSRHYKGRNLGAARIWKCPACGKDNQGRTPEQGCAICGAGDPTKSQAGTDAPAEKAAPAPPGSSRATVDRQGSVREAGLQPAPPARHLTQAVRVLRLIEYIIQPDAGVSVDMILRNSLVGRMEMGWGTLTAAIVDSCDMRQEDLLNMARRQPGVWLTNKDAMAAADRGLNVLTREPTLHDILKQDWRLHTPNSEERPRIMQDQPSIPDTGPAYSLDDALVADAIIQACGLKLANTIALALSQIAPELEANAEAELFISADEALRLANAIMQKMPNTLQIPTMREGESPGVEETPPPAPGLPDTRIKGVVERMQAASRPTPVFREPPPQEES